MRDQYVLLAGAFQGQGGVDRLKAILDSAVDNLSVITVENGVEALSELARNFSRYFLVVADLNTVDLPEGVLVQGVRGINPGVEMVLVGRPGLTWVNLDLPRYLRPILLNQNVDPDSLLSCVIKLIELVEVKQGYTDLSQGFRGHISLAKKNVEAVLSMVNRPTGFGMISMRRDGFFTFYNPEARRLTGYSQDEVPHIRIWAETLMRDPAALQSTLTKFNRFWIDGASREEIPLRIRHKEGMVVNLSTTVLIIQDDKGEPRQMVILLYDPKDWAGARAFRTMMNFGPLGMYTYYQRDGLARISARALELINEAFDMELTEEDLLGRQFQDMPLPPEAASIWQNHMDELMAAGPGETPTPPLLGRPGRRILSHLFISPFGEGDGGQIGVVALVAERPDLRAEAYEELGTPQLCQLTLMNMAQPFLLLKVVRDKDGVARDFKILGLNMAAGSLFKRRTRDGIPTGLEEVFPDESARRSLFPHLREVAETGVEDEFEMYLRLSKQNTDLSLVKFWAGKVGDGTALFFQDVTAERVEEKALKQYRHIFAHMEESIVVTDLDGYITDWNPASESMYGYTKEEILGKLAFILTDDGSGEPLHQEARNIFRDGDVWKGEYHFTRRDGRPGVASTVFAILKDDQGKSYGTVGLSHDVTESKRLEERLTTRTRELQEKNLALNTLLRHAEEERVRACETVAADVTSKITSGLHQILGAKQNPDLVDNIGRMLLQGLDDTSHNTLDESDPIFSLTEKELEVARLIRMGKTTAEIAFILDKSPDTVRLQRISIRKKLGLNSRDRSLFNYLNKLDIF